MTPSTDRLSAAERREAILDAAVAEIAISGFAGATTADIARRAGISQPYIFRFFPTKKALSLAVVERCWGRLHRDLDAVVPLAGESRLMALAKAYVERLSERRTELMVVLHAYASAEDAEIAAAMRHHLARMFRHVIYLLEQDGHPRAYEEAGGFLSRAFLINAAMAVGLESVLTEEEWLGICGKAEVARIEDRLEQAKA
jgi:AcrR family transcriptional regulator